MPYGSSGACAGWWTRKVLPGPLPGSGTRRACGRHGAGRPIPCRDKPYRADHPAAPSGSGACCPRAATSLADVRSDITHAAILEPFLELGAAGMAFGRGPGHEILLFRRHVGPLLDL